MKAGKKGKEHHKVPKKIQVAPSATGKYLDELGKKLTESRQLREYTSEKLARLRKLR